MASSDNQELEDYRRRIDDIDEQLLRLLAQRMDVVRTIGAYKREHGLPALDQERWQAVLSSLLANAETLHLSPEFITSFYELIHMRALEIEADPNAVS